MNDKVEELVRWVAEIILRHESDCTINELRQHEAKLGDGFYQKMIDGLIDSAKQILSHPDLALILKPQYVNWETELEKAKQSKLALVYPLAKLIKENQNENISIDNNL